MTYFTFLPRTLTLRFFPDDPILVTLPMGDDMDELLLNMAKNLDEAGDFSTAAACLYPVLGRDTAENLLSRADCRDTLSVCQLAGYLLRQYGIEKEKNLSAACQGRQVTSAS